MPPSSIERGGRRRRALGSLLLATAFAQHGAIARAASPSASPGARATADASPSVEEWVQRGILLRRAGDDAAALEVFHQAERKSPGSVRIMLHIVTAAQAAGRWLEASAYLRRVSEHQDDPYYRQYREEIAQVEKLINARVGSFLAVGSPAGAEVSINGNVVGTLPMQRPEPIQSGSYVIEVSLPGYYNDRRTVSVSGGVLARETFALNALPKPVARSGAVAAGASVPSEGPDGEWFERPWVTWALAGTSAALLTTSVVAFSLRESHAERWNDDGACTPLGGGSRTQNCSAERDAAQSAETIGIVTGVAALTFAGAALAQRLVLVDGHGREPQPRASAQCGVGFLALSCQGQF